MYVFALAGDDAECTFDRLAPSLDGRVAAIHLEGAIDGSTADPASRPTPERGASGRAGADTTVALDDGWTATGDGRTLADVVDRLAVDHAYAAVFGAEDAYPAVVAGDAPTVADPLIVADDADALDVDAVREAIETLEPHESLESLVADVKRSASAEFAGAIATFTGRVREREDADDERTHFLEFEKYDGVADRRMQQLAADLESRDGVYDVRLHHRTGRVDVGEDIVFVVVLAGHREEAFRTVADGIDRLKAEVPLFKKEVTEDERFWVHERQR